MEKLKHFKQFIKEKQSSLYQMLIIFSLSANIKRHSNTRSFETLGRNCHNIRRWRKKKIGNLDQFTILTWDVFVGQKTDEVTSLLKENKIVCPK